MTTAYTFTILIESTYVCSKKCEGYRPLNDSSNRVVCRFFNEDITQVPTNDGVQPHRTYRCLKAWQHCKKEEECASS
jgi:hypothetical protein